LLATKKAYNSCSSKNSNPNLTHFFNPMNPALDLIDAAHAAAKRAAHACHNPQARECFEYALALMSESWIAEDGQEARSAGKVIGDVRSALDLFAAMAARNLPNNQ